MPRSNSAYMTIYKNLREKIRSGACQPNEKLPTETEIGATFGVSRVTSRKALEMLEHEGLIYRKQGAGTFVAESSSRTGEEVGTNRMVSMLLPFSTRQGRAVDIIRGAGDYLTPQGYYLNIQICEHNLEREREMLKVALQAPVSGVLFYPISDAANVELLYTHHLKGCRLVTLDKQISNLPIPSAVSDNLHGSYEAVAFLASQGHARIGFVSDIGIDEAVSVRDRYLGYCKALFDARIVHRDADVSMINTGTAATMFPEFFRTPGADPGDSSPFLDFYRKLLTRFLDAPEPITAIHAVNDYVAMHLLAAARSLGVKVPEALSIIGFDDIELAAQLDPPLTTVRQDFYTMGYEGARILLEKPAGAAGAVVHRTVPTTLIERKSVSRRG